MSALSLDRGNFTKLMKLCARAIPAHRRNAGENPARRGGFQIGTRFYCRIALPAGVIPLVGSDELVGSLTVSVGKHLEVRILAVGCQNTHCQKEPEEGGIVFMTEFDLALTDSFYLRQEFGRISHGRVDHRYL